jgi:hypothetical protein
MPYLILWAAMILMFERAMYCGYVVDDDGMFKSVNHLKKKFTFEYMWTAMYGCGFFRNAKQEHLFTIILHGINCSLIYKITGSLLAALLYLFNPINNQTTLWLNGRRYAFSVLAVLLAWAFWPIAPFMAVFCGWLHVTGIMFPLLFLWTPFWWAVPFAGTVAWFFGFKKIRDHIKYRASAFNHGSEYQKITWKKLIIYVKTIGFQFLNCVFPNKPAMYHNFMYYYSQTEEGNKEAYSFNFDFWKGVAVLGFLAYDHSFWSFWFVLFISQWCGIFTVTMLASDRYCSLPNVGAMMLLATYIGKIPAPYNTAVAAGFLVFYAVKYQPLFFAYRNVLNFHQYHLNIYPDGVNSRFFLSKIHIAMKDPYQAFGVIRQGMRYRPYDFKLLLGFIECLFILGKVKSALKAMDFTEKHVPYGEAEDTKNLFDGLRKQFRAEYNDLHGPEKKYREFVKARMNGVKA